MVKLLVTTMERQGARGDDYAWAVDGELAYIPIDVCTNPECGCCRGFTGMASGRATTTALVVDRPDITGSDLAGALADSLERQGWLSGDDTAADRELLSLLLGRVRAAADHFPAGAVLERDGFLVRRRAQVDPFVAPSELAGD
jgi:hypothetical protein